MYRHEGAELKTSLGLLGGKCQGSEPQKCIFVFDIERVCTRQVTGGHKEVV